MDTKTAQKQLVSLITEHLSESIPVTRILTYKPDKSGAVTGRFESLNRVYNFVFKGEDVRYKPAMNADSALFSGYYLERFDAAVAPATVKGTRALPKCTSKSYSCKGGKGVACIPLTNSCRMANAAIGKERLGKIKDLSKSLASSGEDNTKVEATRAKIVEGRMALAVENRAKRAVKPVAKAVEAAKPATAKKEKTAKPKKETKSIADKIKSGKPILSNEVPDTERLGSARLLKYGEPAKTQKEAQNLIVDATHRLNNEFAHDGLVPIAAIKKALGDRVTPTQLKDAVYDGFNSRIQSKTEKEPDGFLDTTKLPKAPDPSYKPVKETSAISEQSFPDLLNKTIKDLDAKGKYEGLVPIYQIRRAIGDKVSRQDFNNYLKNLQGENKLQLQGGGIEDDAKDKLEDSIYTKTSGLRSHLRLLK
jgi:hypothetical protein